MEIHDRQRERDPHSDAADRRRPVAAAVQGICRRVASTNRGIRTGDHPALGALAGDRISAACGGGNRGISDEAPDSVKLRPWWLEVDGHLVLHRYRCPV